MDLSLSLTHSHTVRGGGNRGVSKTNPTMAECGVGNGSIVYRLYFHTPISVVARTRTFRVGGIGIPILGTIFASFRSMRSRSLRVPAVAAVVVV